MFVSRKILGAGCSWAVAQVGKEASKTGDDVYERRLSQPDDVVILHFANSSAKSRDPVRMLKRNDSDAGDGASMNVPAG